MEEEIVYIPKHKKVWLSITKFEKYPEMATEGVWRAFRYLIWLIFIFAVILSVCLMIKFVGFMRQGVDFLDKNFNEITYSEGVLNLDSVNKSATTEWGNVIVNTEIITEEQIKELENKKSLKDLEIIWLRECIIVKYNEGVIRLYYKDILDNFEITSFNKTKIINFVNERLNGPNLYITFLITGTIYLFIGYFIKTLLDVLILSLFGMITTLVAGIRIRYRAVFNMAVYSITLSTILQLIYIIVNTFTGFNVKYFDLMYTAISFICLTAAIFMIKSDVIRQQIELMKVIEAKKQEQKEQKDEEKEEENKKEDKEEDKEEKKEEENNSEERKQKEEKKEEETPPTAEGEA